VTSLPARESLRAAFEDHYLSIFRLCYLLSGRRETAEDLAQEAFVRASSRIEVLPSLEAGRYLRRVAVNLWKNRLRRLAIERRAKYRLIGEAREVATPDDRDDALWIAVMDLPERQRACLVLRYYEGLSEREVAEVLDCAVGTVKSNVSRGLSRLRMEFSDGD
jgi:RNA polymerase sigma factor (sigma-70 family)